MSTTTTAISTTTATIKGSTTTAAKGSTTTIKAMSTTSTSITTAKPVSSTTTVSSIKSTTSAVPTVSTNKLTSISTLSTSTTAQISFVLGNSSSISTSMNLISSSRQMIVNEASTIPKTSPLLTTSTIPRTSPLLTTPAANPTISGVNSSTKSSLLATTLAGLGSDSGQFAYIPSANASIGQWLGSGIALTIYAILALVLLFVGICINRKLNKIKGDLNISEKTVPLSQRNSTANNNNGNTLYSLQQQTTPVVSSSAPKKDLPKPNVKKVTANPVLANALVDFPSFDEKSSDRQPQREEDPVELTPQEEVLIAALSALPATTLQRALSRSRASSTAEPVIEPFRNRAASRLVPVEQIPEDLVSSNSRMETFAMPKSTLSVEPPVRHRTPSVSDRSRNASNEYPEEDTTNVSANVAVFGSPKATMQRSNRNRGSMARDTSRNGF